MMKKVLISFVASLMCAVVGAAEIPVVRTTDVVVVGGTAGAVAAARAAKQAGADVFLIAPRVYLGEDVAGTLNVVRHADDDTSSPIYRAIFAAEKKAKSWPFSYQTSIPSAPGIHRDTTGKMLGDGRETNAAHESVQFDGDVTVTIDLGKVRPIAGLDLVTFHRRPSKKKSVTDKNYQTDACVWSASADGRTWTKPARVTDFREDDRVPHDDTGHRRIFSSDCTGSYRYLRVTSVKDAAYPRQLLAEIRVVRPAEGPVKLADRTTPFIVKKALDRALLDAGVPYLTCSAVCDVVTDEKGEFAGVVMANRNGRQVVRAKVLIDATARGFAAQCAGGKTRPLAKGDYPVMRYVVSGEQPKGKGVKAVAVSEPFTVPVVTVKGLTSAPDAAAKPKFPKKFDARIWACTLEVPFADGSARSFAEADQVVRDRTFTTLQADAADAFIATLPDTFLGRGQAKDWAGVAGFALDALRPRDAARTWVLGPRADVTPAVAAQLTRPGNLLALGARVGAAAAAEAKTLARVDVRSCAETRRRGALRPGERLGEHHQPLPDHFVNASGSVKMSDGALPLLAAVDTVVVGAGTGGAPAAIAAARHGAKTLVVEMLTRAGGVMTDGLIGRYYYGHRVGFTKEIDAGTFATAASYPEAKAEWFRAEMRKAGAEIWFGAFANGVVTDGTRVTGVVVVMADGTRGLVRCANAIDATGNAELAAMAGCETEFIRGDDLSVQGAGWAQKVLGADYTNSDIGFIDDTDVADVFYFSLRSRMSLPAGTWDQAQVVNSRERRRLIGAFYMHATDVVLGRTYPDIITRTYSNFDSHGQTRDDIFFIQDPGHKPMFVNLPYRCLLPKKLEGLLVTGLGISAHRDAMPILRMQPDVQNQGYAAGTAAAMAVKDGTTVRAIDIKKLQRHLVEKKILRADDLNMTDNFPLANEAFDRASDELADNYKGLAVLFTDRARALPRLRASYGVTEGEGKLVYAHVLALMGDAIGAKVLLAKFESMGWDKGWNYRGMGQYNRSVSWVDSYAIALGHARAREAVPALLKKTAELSTSHEYSHFRAMAMALEEIGDQRAIPVLAEVLKKPGIGGHAVRMGAKVPVIPRYANKAADQERTRVLRELCLARALYRLGDTPDQLGAKTLKAYRDDPRRAYANHARLVLGK